MSIFSERITEAMKPYSHLGLQEGAFTIGALVSAVLKIITPEDAAAFYESYVDYLGQLPKPPASPVSVARSNIGWCFGEGMSHAKIAMWVKACGASHPVFGVIPTSPAEAFEMGRKLGVSTKGGDGL